jgi:hypothetical protein
MSDAADPHDDALPEPAGAVPAGAAPGPQAGPSLDLDAIERDLADVEAALARLDAGTYWTDEVTGEALPDELLAVHPTARRHAAR